MTRVPAFGPLTMLARLCRTHSTPRRRAMLAERTLEEARKAARAYCRRGWLRRCDIDCAATDAAAWCMSDGLRSFNPVRASWTTFVSLAVRREARRISADEERQARVRGEIARMQGEGGDSHF